MQYSSLRKMSVLISVIFAMLIIEPANGIFSTYRCVGQAQNDREDEINRAHKRHCVFHNVCHKKGSGDNLFYFEDSRTMSSPKDSAFNKFNYDFYAGKWVQLGAFSNLSPVWGPKIVRSEVGINETIFQFDRNASRYVLHQPWSDSNPGHFMETMLSLFGLPRLLGYEFSRDIQLLDAEPSSIMINNKEGLKLGERHRKELLYSLSDHTPVFFVKARKCVLRNSVRGDGHALSSASRDLCFYDCTFDAPDNAAAASRIVALQKYI